MHAEAESSSEDARGEYALVRMPFHRGSFSIVAFVGALHYAKEYDWGRSWTVVAAVSATLLLTGLVLAGSAWRTSRRRGGGLRIASATGVGLLLNVGGLLVIVFSILAFLFERFRPG